MATALRAVQPTPYGGDTCWSSMYAAWEGLSEPMRAMLDGLTAVHSIQPTLDRMGQYSPRYLDNYAPRHAPEQVHPVVLTHPETGRKALYVNESFTTRIVELSAAESAALLTMLFRHIEKPDFTMRWKWTANDVAFWDNRCAQHYAVPDYSASRVMQRIVLAGVRPGENAVRAATGETLAA
jgi:taurine dioxygenase